MMKSRTRRGIRWWPAAFILVLWAAFQVWVWWAPDHRQAAVMATAASSLLAIVLLLLWLVALSRLPWLRRLIAFVLVIGLGVAVASLFEVTGFTGNLVPIFELRGGDRAGELEIAGGSVAATLGDLAAADDAFPQFLGPRRDGTVRGVALATGWDAEPPELLWRRPVGEGWGSFAVVGGIAVTQEQRGEEEMVVAYRLADGEPLWAHSDRTRYSTSIAGTGPRSTPTIADGAVYTLGGTGLLNALDLASGELLWQRDVLDDNGATAPQWGKACSPLVVGDLVVVSAGGAGGRSLVAYGRQTGEPVWSGGSDASGYSSPFIAELAGRPQIVIFNRGTVAGHDPADGSLLWSHPWRHGGEQVSQPVPLGGDRLFVSVGYGGGGELLRIVPSGEAEDGDPELPYTAELIWHSPRLKAKFTNVVLHDGFLYGLDDGVYVCLDPEDGQRRWKAGRYGHGQTLLAGDHLLVQAEDGEVVLLEATPEEHRELASFTPLTSKTWNHPTLLPDGTLLVRNDREAAAYRLPLAE